ncbi:MAG TPA: TIM barrel protein [Candidatus Methylacidiphilales bacterium]|nr:TIM barrel protein [Candidatus Methylacidiphilales bacterium]
MSTPPSPTDLPPPGGSRISRQQLACSTLWNYGRHRDGTGMIRQLRSLGFNAAEISASVRPAYWPGIIHAAESGSTRIVSIHRHVTHGGLMSSASPQITDTSLVMRRRAVEEYQECIRRAASLGSPAHPAPVVILNLGNTAMRDTTSQLEQWYRRDELLSRQYVAAKIRATRERKELFPLLWERVKECLTPLVETAGELRVRLAIETGATFEAFPHEEEMDEVLEAFPQNVLGYWHDFGHAARKEFLGWHTHAETLVRRRPRLFGCHIHDCRAPAEDHLPLGHGEINFVQLAPLLPQHCVAVLELGGAATDEQLIASRNRWSALWNSYANT